MKTFLLKYLAHNRAWVRQTNLKIKKQNSIVSFKQALVRLT